MAMKKFKITYTRYGQFGTYHEEDSIMATSEKMAIKKFMNKKSFDGRTTKQEWNYDTWANGVTYSDPVATEIKD